MSSVINEFNKKGIILELKKNGWSQVDINITEPFLFSSPVYYIKFEFNGMFLYFSEIDAMLRGDDIIEKLLNKIQLMIEHYAYSVCSEKTKLSFIEQQCSCRVNFEFGGGFHFDYDRNGYEEFIEELVLKYPDIDDFIRDLQNIDAKTISSYASVVPEE